MRQTLKAIALHLDAKFNSEIASIRSTLEIDLDSEEGYGSKEFITIALSKEVARLRSKFNIGKSAENYLQELILTGEVFQSTRESILTMHLHEETGYSIRVHKDTSFDQVKRSFDVIQKTFNPDLKKKTRHKEYLEFERDYRMCQMDHDGATVEEIWRAIKKEYGADLHFGTITKTISNFRARFGIQKPIHK